jgi:hypothetical protein
VTVLTPSRVGCPGVLSRKHGNALDGSCWMSPEPGPESGRSRYNRSTRLQAVHCYKRENGSSTRRAARQQQRGGRRAGACARASERERRAGDARARTGSSSAVRASSCDKRAGAGLGWAGSGACSRERDPPSLQRCRPDDTGKESLHTRREQGGVGSDPPPGLAIQRARVCGFEAHMLARAAPKVGLTHGIPARGKEGRRVLNFGPGISGGRTKKPFGETFSGSSHPALHGAPV